MPRPRQVTRTVQVTEVKTLVVDTVEHHTIEMLFTLAGSFSNQSTMLNRIKKLYETETLIPVRILQSHITSYHYTMPEQEYIDNATKLI